MYKMGMLNSTKLKVDVPAMSLFFLLLLPTISQAEFVVMPDEEPEWAPASVDTHSETSDQAMGQQTDQFVDQQAEQQADEKQQTAQPVDALGRDSMHRGSMQRHSMQMPTMHMPATQRNAPHWSRHQAMQNAVPPPPPGPYKSTALSEFSKQGHASGHVQRESEQQASEQQVSEQQVSEQKESGQLESVQIEAERQLDPAQVPMQVYNPERPWPENIRPANPWAPGYSQHPSAPQYSVPANPAAMYNYPVDGFYGYRPGANMRAPYMQAPGMQAPYMQVPDRQAPANWSNMNTPGSRWMPSMDAGSWNPGAAYSHPEAPYSGRPYGY